MNIVSTMVGITIMGAAAPSVMRMTLAPVEAQARAKNFSTAESAAVAFAAANEGQRMTDLSIKPGNCENPVASPLGGGAFDITCWGGQSEARGDDRTSDYYQEVTRSYSLASTAVNSYTNPTRSFAFATPKAYSHVECQTNDPWGVMWYNEHLKAGHLDACQPSILRSKQAYLDSNPDDWLYDISDHGYGRHPDY